MTHDGPMDLAYFWSSLLTVLLPAATFITIAVLVTRGYLRRKTADGGGPPPYEEKGEGRGT